MFNAKLYLAVAACCATAAAGPARADDASAATPEGIRAAPVVVTATRVEQNSFDLPVSIDVIDAETIHDGQAQVNLSETAVRIPGVIVNNRNNYAQDLAISTRGFGARSAFGVRGVRLYADGIPMSMPDGQGQSGTFNLDTAKRIEFLRGPFSTLYGNSSGGVVQIFTADGPQDHTLSGGTTFGSDSFNRESITAGGQFGNVNYLLNASDFYTSGFRDHGAARRETFNGKVAWKASDQTTLTFLGTALDQPMTQDPLGLSKAQYNADFRQAGTGALTFNTRVERNHQQIGLNLEHKLSENDVLNLVGWYGQRYNLQYQSSSVASQKTSTNFAKNGGGVAEIDRNFGGVDLRWNHKGSLANAPYDISGGLNYETMQDARKGYENFVGYTGGTTCGVGTLVCGVKGALRRDEINTVYNFDQYLQGSWDIHPLWSISGGIRHTAVNFRSEDHYISGINGDDSGSATFSNTSEVAGLTFRATPAINLYANIGRSYETPTFIEMSYLPPDSTLSGGLNTALKPSRSNNYEIGVKAMLGDSTRLNLAAFRIDTSDEIIIFTTQNGRSTYKNVNKSGRNGLEFSLDSQLSHGFNTYLAYAFLDAKIDSSFQACNAPVPNRSVCATTDLVTIGPRATMPGVYRHTLFGELSWKYQPAGFSAAFEAKGNSKAYANYQNTAIASGYATFAWHGGFSQNVSHWKFNEFVRVDNLADRKYVSSIRIGDLNAEYYEPGAPRSWLAGVSASYHF